MRFISAIALSFLFVFFLIGCANDRIHPPTMNEKKFELYGEWYKNVSKIIFEANKVYKMSDEASDMLWLETVIKIGDKEGYLHTSDEQNWVRKFYGEKLFKSSKLSSISINEIETKIRKFGDSNPPPLLTNTNDKVMVERVRKELKNKAYVFFRRTKDEIQITCSSSKRPFAYVGKLTWLPPGYWYKEIVIYNSVIQEPPPDHEIWRYVRSLEPPSGKKGTKDYDPLFLRKFYLKQ